MNIEGMKSIFLGGTATVRAMGHEGHVMPSSPKPPAVKPVKEKIKPKAPPTAKPPAKKSAEPPACGAQPPWTLVHSDIKRLVQLKLENGQLAN